MSELRGLLEGKRLLLFDLDGTLADTTPLHAQAFAQVLAPLGVPVDYARIAGMKTADALRKCFEDAGRAAPDPADLERLTSAKQDLVRKLIRTHLKPLPGVKEFLAWCSPRFRLALASSGSRETVRLSLQTLGLEELFDPVICGEDTARAKPAPDPFLRAVELTGIPPQEVLVFEDSENGFAAARAARLACVDATRLDWSI